MLAQNFNSEALGMQPTHSFLACVRPWVPSPVGKERKGRRKNRYRQTDRQREERHRQRQKHQEVGLWWHMPIFLALEKHEKRKCKV